jgi:hypothetical protein
MRIVLISLTFLLLSCSAKNEYTSVLNKQKRPDVMPEPIVAFNPEQYVCYKTGTPLTIDGKMDEPVWQNAEWTKDFLDIEGVSKPKPRFRTRAKMLWDEVYFYIFAEMQEPDVWATLTKRDAIIFYDNDFEVFIDPNGDTHRYYELEINSFSTEWDLFLDKPYRDDCRPLFYWDIRGLKSKTQINGTINKPGDEDKGWTLEIAMPWVVLKEAADKNAPPSDGDQWRVNFSRVEWKVKSVNGKYEKVINPDTGKPFPEDNWVWSPQGVINMHYPEMWGFVQFSEKVAGTEKAEFIYQKEEGAKWALRQIYYKQRKFFSEKGRYAPNTIELGLNDQKIIGYIWPPLIQTTSDMYEAILLNKDKTEVWHMNQDGLVWKN